MKISCQSCQAKYTIADEKVVGKVVKIRCKKCGATIVINGAEGHAEEASAGGGEVFDYAAGAGDQWTVNVAEGDQRTMSTQDIVNEYRAGVVSTETYCWKDGMDGWLPLRDIDQLHRAVASPSVHPVATNTGGEFAPSAAPLFGASGGGGGGGSLFGDNPSASAPAAARRERAGRNQGADLFGGAAQAGSENDRMVSAAAASKEEPKLTGQRNESSVLFSLSALTKEGEKNGGGGGGSAKPENKTTAQGDASGLIDIRALSSANSKADKPKSSGVDDIMNLGGGGAFGAALAAPILAPPAMDHGAVAASELGATQGNKGNKGIIFAIVGGVAFLTVAVVLAIVFTRPPAPEPNANNGSGHSGATGPSALAQNDPPKDTAAAANTPPPTPATTEAATAKEPGAGTVAAATGPKTTPNSGGGTKKPESGGGAAPHEPTPPPAAPAGTSLEAKMRAAAGQTAAPAAAPAPASGAPFDRGAAAASLGSINVASCKKPDGPTGSGHVNVTFEPSGAVSSAVVDGGPFPGTPVGGCIAGKFRGARVPAFGGSSVKVGKSFTL